MLTHCRSDIPTYLPIEIYIEINGNSDAFEISVSNLLCLQERCILDGTLTVNYEQVDTEYRLRHNDLLANIVHRYVIKQDNQNEKKTNQTNNGCTATEKERYVYYKTAKLRPLMSRDKSNYTET